MLLLLRKLHYGNIMEKIYLIKLKTILGYDIIESWRLQKYQNIIYNNMITDKKKMINDNNINYYINNIFFLLFYLRYQNIFNKYSINIDLFSLLLNNLSSILYFYNITYDELIEYIIVNKDIINNNNNIKNNNNIRKINNYNNC
jgi:hypothetical protein